ncbi:uncharacterized protein LOC101857479 [Aplysia californica]|uniref:Uncharacterized protein LOC101857479 n=1 Tax=Aplysia californica TaxID=6500 RepID=A0ABM0JKM6_APLCA|nr:uncharacterized protein LOC101857479 [Aplysia californica]
MASSNVTAIFSTTTSVLVSEVLRQRVDSKGESEVFSPSEYFVKTNVRQVSEIVIDFCLSLVISVVGVVTNAIILVVFYRQGFKDSVNISMSYIAFWDLVKCMAGTLQRMAGPIGLFDAAAKKSWTNVGIVAFNYLICFSSYVSSVLAAYVALERCLCVSIPFQVKFLLTPKFTFAVCTAISVVVLGSFAVIWGIYDVYRVFDDTYNKTVIIYKYNEFYQENEGPLFEYYNLSGIIWPMFSFVVIVVCTSIIVFQLQKSSKFRSASSSAGRGEDLGQGQRGNQLSGRDKQVVKMLLVIIIIYVVNLSPRIALYLAKYLIYDFYFLRNYHNLFLVISYVLFIFDLSNGAVNIFVFMSMSSSFKATFSQTFSFGRGSQGSKP